MGMFFHCGNSILAFFEKGGTIAVFFTPKSGERKLIL
jgi:hypothetical protein